jgi:hypothetical protein
MPVREALHQLTCPLLTLAHSCHPAAFVSPLSECRGRSSSRRLSLFSQWKLQRRVRAADAEHTENESRGFNSSAVQCDPSSIQTITTVLTLYLSLWILPVFPTLLPHTLVQGRDQEPRPCFVRRHFLQRLRCRSRFAPDLSYMAISTSQYILRYSISILRVRSYFSWP